MLLKEESQGTLAICDHPKCNNIAVQGCIACRKALCRSHHDTLHEFYPSHEAVSISQYQQLTSELCEAHGLPLTAYCIHENKLRCPTCSHACMVQEHSVIPFKQLVERGKYVCGVCPNDEILRQELLVSQLAKDEEDLQKETNLCLDKVHEKFAAARKVLDAKEAELVSSISEIAGETTRRITTEKESTQAELDTLRILLDRESLLQHDANSVSLLKYAKAFRSIVASSKVSSSSSKEQNLCFKFSSASFSTMSNITRSLGLMQTDVTLEKVRPRVIQAVMLGIQGSGKTSLLYKLKLDEFSEHSTTIGFNQELVQHGEIGMQIDDVGGQEKMRPLWKNFVKADSIVMFVVDSGDNQKLAESKLELHRVISMMREAKLLASCKKNPFVLVFGNKQDLPTAAGARELSHQLGLRPMENLDWFVQPCCAVTGEGIHEGIEEALHMMKEN